MYHWFCFVLLWACLQLRRHARLRREYLYRKSVEDKERTVLDRKRKIQDSIAGPFRGREGESKEREGAKVNAYLLPICVVLIPCY